MNSQELSLRTAMPALPKHFNFLKKYGERLETDIGYKRLAHEIPVLRERALSGEPGDLDNIAFKSRKITERFLKALVPYAGAKMSLQELIKEAASHDLISQPVAHKCQDIRILGNKGAHASVKAAEAKQSLALLDHILRWYVVEHYQDGQEDPFPPEYDDSLFVPKAITQSESFTQKANLAADLSGNSSLRIRALEAYNTTSKATVEFNHGIDEIARRISDTTENGGSPDTLSAKDTSILEQCDAKLEELSNVIIGTLPDLEAASQEVDNILSEHDFIEKLLHGRGKGTLAQWRVMRFPQSFDSATRILQIAGGAGTGKTLCLVAKTLRELENCGQARLFEKQKRALFVCFNRDLAIHVHELVSGFPESSRMTIVTHDSLVNKLVKPEPDNSEFARYATSSRYKSGWKLHYGSTEWSSNRTSTEPRPLIESIDLVAEFHPKMVATGAYYLDTFSTENLSWLNDELGWIEGHYSSLYDAKNYLTDTRTGRGSSGHKPNKTARDIILEIWEVYGQKLDEYKMYTIEQATKRLLVEKNLPKYDIIAIGEIQDLSINEIRFLLKLRRSDTSKAFLAGDENQKIFQRDFTWKELDSGARGYTITLDTNKRNTPSIQCFSERLLDTPCSYEQASPDVFLLNQSRNETLWLIEELLKHEREKTAIIGNSTLWKTVLGTTGIPYRNPRDGIAEPGLYLVGERTGKGLEFDNVIVDYEKPFYPDDVESEKRLRYMHFTRTIKKLCIRYAGMPPALLQKYYPDFIEHEIRFLPSLR